MQRLLCLALAAAAAAAAAVLAVDVPADCTAVCDASQKLIDACMPVTVQCSCTEPYERGLYDCGVCVGNGNATDYALQQVQLDAFVDACQSRGVALPRLSYPGQGNDTSVPASNSESSTSTSMLTDSSASTPTSDSESQPTDTPSNSAALAGQARAWLIAVALLVTANVLA